MAFLSFVKRAIMDITARGLRGAQTKIGDKSTRRGKRRRGKRRKRRR